MVIFYRIFGVFRRPKAKAAMVFGCNNDSFHARFFANTSPLTAIGLFGIKQLNIFITKPPRLVGIGI